MRSSFVERFWRKVDTTGDCWLWTGARNGQGYGRLYVTGTERSMMAAHRASFFIHFGPFDQQLIVCHRCDNPSCVRPEHLFLGDAKDNAQDRSRKGRGAKERITHCPQGHAYTDENTYHYANPSPRRYCRACMRQRNKDRMDATYWRNYREKRKAQGRPVGTRAEDTDADRLAAWMVAHEGECGA